MILKVRAGCSLSLWQESWESRSRGTPLSKRSHQVEIHIHVYTQTMTRLQDLDINGCKFVRAFSQSHGDNNDGAVALVVVTDHWSATHGEGDPPPPFVLRSPLHRNPPMTPHFFVRPGLPPAPTLLPFLYFFRCPRAGPRKGSV